MILGDAQLSENFQAGEFRCRGAEQGQPCSCHGAILIQPRTVEILQGWRNEIGPIHPTNAFRCDTWNAHVNGHPGSFHRTGNAVDGTSKAIREALRGRHTVIWDLVDICEALAPGACNIILYPDNGFIHLDDGHRVDHHLVRVKWEDGTIQPWEATRDV